jgi:glucuronate isomerase
MKKFMGKKFMLHTGTAAELFDAVRDLPIIDYHCHLNPAEIAGDRRFKNLTEIWLAGDHYKWRLMRANGVPEAYVTGDADDYEKFQKWSETVEESIGNPLYHWTHLELDRAFGYDGVLCGATAREVWDHCNAVLARPDFSVTSLLRLFRVETLCTTDDPSDTLDAHKKIAKNPGVETKVLPAFRPAAILELLSPGWRDAAARLVPALPAGVQKFDDIAGALCKRADFFHRRGCRLSDHALDPPLYAEATPAELDAAVAKAQQGGPVTDREAAQYKTALLLALGRKYASLGWAMQFHIGALRNVNSRMARTLGPDTGFDCTGDAPVAGPLAKLLDALEAEAQLPPTILYCLNARDNQVLAPLAQCFQGGMKGKIQFGTGWWHNDHADGMRRQMTDLASMGLFTGFVGMLTDSRSFLSYTRHEYFRRILCNLLGDWAERGEYPRDMKKLTEIARNISYFNAKAYFGF